jgi:hypothetical protein
MKIMPKPIAGEKPQVVRKAAMKQDKERAAHGRGKVREAALRPG